MRFGVLVPTRSHLQSFRGMGALGATDCSGVFTAGFSGGLATWSDWISGAGPSPWSQVSGTTFSCDPMFALGVALPPVGIAAVLFMFVGGGRKRR